MTKRLPGPRPTPAQLAAARANSMKVDYASQREERRARLRAWHVAHGHMVKDPTTAELMAIAQARLAKAQP